MWRFRRRKGGERKLYRLRVTIPDVVMITRESVVSSSYGAGHHTAGVELQLGLKGFWMICVTNIIAVRYNIE